MKLHFYPVFLFGFMTLALGQPVSAQKMRPDISTVQSKGPTVSLPASITVELAEKKNRWLDALQIAGPYAAAILAFLAAGIVLFQVRIEARHTYAAEILAYRFRQVQEFYAPAFVCIEESRALYEKLIWTIREQRKEIPMDGFRLLDHIHRFKGDPQLKPLVDSILAIGTQLTGMISKNAGLIEGGITPTFIEYQAHFAILNAASEQELSKEQKDGWHEFGYYPRMLNREVREGYKVVLAHLDNYTSAGDKIISRLLGQKAVERGEYRRRLIENLQYYEDRVKEYAEKFDAYDLSAVRQRFITVLRKTREARRNHPDDKITHILDVGCGTGRDTIAFLKLGFAVTAVDASPAMLRECRRKLRSAKERPESSEMGAAATASRSFEKTFDEIGFRDEFDGVWAAASLLHVPPHRMTDVLRKLMHALVPGGILFMSFRYGQGEREFDGRSFSSLDRRGIRSLLKRVPEAEELEIWLSSNEKNVQVPSAEQRWAWARECFNVYPRDKWINVLVKRQRC